MKNPMLYVLDHLNLFFTWGNLVYAWALLLVFALIVIACWGNRMPDEGFWVVFARQYLVLYIYGLWINKTKIVQMDDPLGLLSAFVFLILLIYLFETLLDLVKFFLEKLKLGTYDKFFVWKDIVDLPKKA